MAPLSSALASFTSIKPPTAFTLQCRVFAVFDDPSDRRPVAAVADVCGVHTIHPRGRFLIASMGIPSRFARTSIVLGLIRANHWFDFANLNPERPDARSNANGRVVRGLRRRRAVVGTWRRGWSAGALLDRYKGRVGAVTAVRRHWTRQAEHGVCTAYRTKANSRP